MTQRQIEIFSAGCELCSDTVELVNNMVCGSCTVEVHDMQDPKVAKRAKGLGVRAAPAVVIDGKLADCCASGGVDRAALSAAGVGQPLP